MRRLAWVLAVATLLVGMAAAALALRGQQLAVLALRAALDRAGIAASGLEVRGLGLGGMTLGPVRLGDADGPSAEGIVIGWSAASVLAGRVDRVHIQGLRLALVEDDGQMRVRGLDMPGARGGSGGLPWRAMAIGDARVAITTAGGTARIDVEAELAETAPDVLSGRAKLDAVLTPTGGRPERLTADVAQLMLALAPLRIEIMDAALRAPDRQLGIAGLTGWLDLAGAPPLRLRAKLHDTATPAGWPALTVELRGRQEADRFSLAGQATSADRALTLALKASHHPGDGRGEAVVDLAPLRFAADGRQPADLFPAAGRGLARVTGTVAAQAVARWGGGGVQTSLQLDLAGLGFDSAHGELRELNGRIALAPAWPPRTTAPQRLTARLGLAGLPPGALDLRFSLPAEGTLRLDGAGYSLAGGTLSLAAVTLRRDQPVAATLEVRALDLAAALHLLDIDGLGGEGRLDGAIPLRVGREGVSIEAGRLRAAGPGVLRYAGDKLPEAIAGLQGQAGEAIRLARQALTDFRYKTLELTIDRAADGQGSLLLHLAGSNPAVLDNHPFVLNIRLEANFDRLALLLLDGYAAAEGLLRQAARP